jgi:hypothetical protein
MAIADTRRRSWRSAVWPAGSVHSTIGTNWASPTIPSMNVLWVSSYICQPTATATI